MDDISFWVAQIIGVIGGIIMFLRMGKSCRRQFDLYHTFFCIPFAMQYMILGAWTMAVFCIVGGTRTFLLTTNWGWEKRSLVVFSCLGIAISIALFTASSALDWLLMAMTIWCVGSEAFKNFFNLRVATFFNTLAWALNSLFSGAIVVAIADFLVLANNVRAMERDYSLLSRLNPVRILPALRLGILARLP